MAQILHKTTGEILFEDKDKSIRELALANLSNLSYANLRYANLSSADLRYADLSYADLRYADLSYADLSSADLRYADLRYADLSYADLSYAKGLKRAADFLSQFEQDEFGILVYKRIGNGKDKATEYALKTDWKIKKLAFLEENPNPTKTQECGCGVNFGTLEWCKKNYTDADLWLCRIAWIDLADVVVPFETDGKARCARLQLIKKVKV